MKRKSLILLLLSLMLLGNSIFADTAKAYVVEISVNISGYDFYIDNKQIKGTKAKLKEGTHIFKVTAPGYKDYEKKIKVEKNFKLKVVMEEALYQLDIETNTSSIIYLNDKKVTKSSYSKALEPGKYKVRVEADGYSDYEKTIILDEDTQLFIELQSGSTIVMFNFPEEMINQDLKNPMNEIFIYDNGELLDGFKFKLKPGKHRIRIESGAFVIEDTFVFKAGKKYLLEPTLELELMD